MPAAGRGVTPTPRKAEAGGAHIGAQPRQFRKSLSQEKEKGQRLSSMQRPWSWGKIKNKTKQKSVCRAQLTCGVEASPISLRETEARKTPGRPLCQATPRLRAPGI